eukprot:jgi/Hompol1/3162/HPOL_006376-RA
MFNTSTQVTALSKGDYQVMFMRFFVWDGDRASSPRTYTGAYYVAVDDYSILTVPASEHIQYKYLFAAYPQRLYAV